MNISTVQKRRLLEHIYKSFYSSGVKPTDQQIKKAFSDWFTTNKPGFPVGIDYVALQSSRATSADLLNEIMINNLYNIDILYDTILENNDELFGVVTALNRIIDNLKNRRKMLESKIDDLLFTNNNTDGYFYSYTENFSSILNIDTFFSTGYVDVGLGSASMSPQVSGRYTIFAVDNLSNLTPSISLYENGVKVSSVVDATDFNNIFDGLNDTYWMKEHRTVAPVPVSVGISIPISSNAIISKVEGYLSTSSPVIIQLRVSYSDGSPDDFYIKSSASDYSSFSFSIKPKNYSNIELTMVKNEPDFIDNNSLSPYVYRMGLRDLIIGSNTVAKTGTIVSKPISLPGNTNQQIFIDAVSISVEEQFINDGVIQYYVSQDNLKATSISDFNWIPISPSGSENAGFPSVVNFNGSTKNIVYISQTPKQNQLGFIPISTDAKNINDLNPTTKIYAGKQVYRIAALSLEESYNNPVLLGNVDSFKHYYTLDGALSRYQDTDTWIKEINSLDSNLLSNNLTEQLGNIAPGINSPSSGYIKTKIITDKPITIRGDVVKSINSFNLAIYLNGLNIANLPAGKLDQSIQWDLLEGLNEIVITYDKPVSGPVSFSLIEGENLSTYGSIFTDYFFYLDKFNFMNRNMDDNLYFTIDAPYGRKEILASSPINSLSRFSYISKEAAYAPAAIRYRVDFARFNNPFSAPKLDSLKIKFKHKDL